MKTALAILLLGFGVIVLSMAQQTQAPQSVEQAASEHAIRNGTGGQAASGAPATRESPRTIRESQPAARNSQLPVRFTTLDVVVDPKGRPLAAYQFEFEAEEGRVMLVGIEGGESPVFAEPPYYDPQALMGGRVIIADFSTADVEKLPTGPTRVTTLHVRVMGEQKPEYELELMTAATVGGEEISAEIEIRRDEGTEVGMDGDAGT